MRILCLLIKRIDVFSRLNGYYRKTQKISRIALITFCESTEESIRIFKLFDTLFIFMPLHNKLFKLFRLIRLKILLFHCSIYCFNMQFTFELFYVGMKTCLITVLRIIKSMLRSLILINYSTSTCYSYDSINYNLTDGFYTHNR